MEGRRPVKCLALAVLLLAFPACEKETKQVEAPPAAEPAPVRAPVAAAASLPDAAPAAPPARQMAQLSPEAAEDMAAQLKFLRADEGAKSELRKRPGADLGKMIAEAKDDPGKVAIGGGKPAASKASVSTKIVADTEAYTVKVTSPGSAKAGAEGKSSLQIIPKAGWHLNKEFPTRLSIAAPDGVTVRKPEQTVADAASFEEKAATWGFAWQVTSAGQKAFACKMKFAVCTDTTCDPKKEEVAWNVTVE